MSENKQGEVDATAACPNCGGANFEITRENVGWVSEEQNRGRRKKEKVSKQVYRTVQICQDCGNTRVMAQDGGMPEEKSGSKTWLWVLGWICCFPIPTTILLLRNKEMKPSVRNGWIAAAWVAYLILAIVSQAMSGGTGSSGTRDLSEPPLSSTAVEAVSAADLDASIARCVADEQYANGSGFNNRPRAYGSSSQSLINDPTDANMSSEELARNIVNPDGNDSWVEEWLAARDLTGGETVMRTEVRLDFTDSAPSL